MASCWRLRAAVQIFHRKGASTLSVIQSSFSCLAPYQARPEVVLDSSKLTCFVRTPAVRHEVTFARKRRKYAPQYKEDGVSDDWQCVFDNNMNRYHFWGQLFVNGLSLPIYGLSFKIIWTTWHLQDFSVSGGLLTTFSYLLLYSVFFAGVNILCHRSIKRIYADGKSANFAAVTQDWKMSKRTVFFTLNDAKRLPPGRVLGSFLGNVAIKGRPYLLTPTDFVLPKYYNLIMGYDLQRSIDLDIIKDINIRDIKQMIEKEQEEEEAKLQKKKQSQK